MKKMLAVLVTALALTAGAFAENKTESGSVGIGITTGVTDFQGNPDKFKLNLFLGYGWNLFGPFFVGGEFNMNIQNIGKDSSTATVLESTIIATDGNGGFWTYYNVAGHTYETNYWNIDVSPRAYLSFEPADFLMGQAYIGFNKNSYTWDSTDTNTSTGKVVRNNGTLMSTPWQFVMGLRGTLSWFYLDYTRYFDINSNRSGIDPNKFNSDRFTLGASLRF